MSVLNEADTQTYSKPDSSNCAVQIKTKTQQQIKLQTTLYVIAEKDELFWKCKLDFQFSHHS